MDRYVRFVISGTSYLVFPVSSFIGASQGGDIDEVYLYFEKAPLSYRILVKCSDNEGHILSKSLCELFASHPETVIDFNQLTKQFDSPYVKEVNSFQKVVIK